MTEQVSLEEFRALGLLPHQAQFLAEFLKPESPRHHILAAPVGTGKSYLGTVLIAELLRRSEGRRILILTSASLRAAYHHSLLKHGITVPIEEIDRRRFRELEARVPVGDSPWPEAIIALISIDTAKQKDLMESLGRVRWDLVLIEEAHLVRGTQREDLLKHLFQKDAIGRLLVFTIRYAAMNLDVLAGTVFGNIGLQFKKTEWGVDLKDWSGGVLFRRFQLRSQIVYYTRAPEEVEFLNNLRWFVEGLSWTSEGKSARDFFINLIYKRASSSIFAIEQTLLGLHRKWLEQASAKRWTPDLDEEEAMESVTVSAASLLADTSQTFENLGLLIRSLDKVSSDEKQKAMINVLRTLRRPKERQKRWVLILAAFRDTVSYLHTSISEWEEEVGVLTGGMLSEDKVNLINRFEAEGGVLVGTWGSVMGFTLPYVDSVILYDVPDNAPQMEQIRGRVERIGRTKPCDWFVFRDNSNALPFEREALERFGIPEEQSK